MEQRLIDANKLIYKRCDDSATRATFDFVADGDIEGAETVLTIPEDPTNGDMIKVLFPNGKVITNNDEGEIGYEVLVDRNYSFCSWFDVLWWNSPWKGVGDETD